MRKYYLVFKSNFLAVKVIHLLIIVLSYLNEVSSQNSINHDIKISSPIYKDGKYANPESFGFKSAGFGVALKWMFTKDNGSTPESEKIAEQTLPLTTPVFDINESRQGRELQSTWIGHATTLTQMDGVTFLNDPIWSERASPVSFSGPKRYRPTPVKIEDLPNVDFVMISHNHYDHLDLDSVKALHERFQPTLRWFVPMGQKEWFTDSGITNVTEMTWDQTIQLPGTTVNVTCLPARHWSNRALFDRFKSLWSSWAVIGPHHRFYFTGDSGYAGEEFKKIGLKYGPFDMAAIPIGCYEPRSEIFMQYSHMDPDEAVLVHQAIQSKHSFAIHWGTFPMGCTENYLSPRYRLTALVEENIRNETIFRTLQHGETWVID